MSSTVYTERGDVVLDVYESRLYARLASDRFRVFTREELCKATERTPRQLDATAATLRGKFREIGLDYVHNVWGVGFRLEDR